MEVEANPIPGILPGTFSATVTGLTAGVKYSYTAYAYNSTSISYTPAATFTTANALAITTGTLLSWDVNLPGYQQQIVITGGTGILSIRVVVGQLPTGLTLNSSTGVISGTPTVVGSNTFTIMVLDVGTGNTLSQSYTVTINPAVTFQTTSLPNAVLNQAGYNQTILAASGTGAITYATPFLLPTGLTLNSATGVISGTPTVGGTFTFTVTATDSVGGTASKSFSITVSSSTTAPTVTTATVSTLTGTGATLGGTVTANGGSALGGVGFFYAPATTNSNPQQGGTGAVEVDATIPGSLPGTFSANVTGLTAGVSYSFTAYAYNSIGISYAPVATFTPSVPTSLTLTPAGPALRAWDVNFNGYFQTIGVTGGTGSATFAVTSGVLPPGLILNASTGAITGTPTQANTGLSTFAFDITATKGLSSVTGLYTIYIASPPMIVRTTLANGVLNQAYPQALFFTGGSGNYSFILASGQYPPGVTLNSSSGLSTGTPTADGTYNFTSGLFSGTPTAVGTYNFSLEVVDSLQTSPAMNFSITIANSPSPQITSQPQDVTVNAGQPATFTVAATGTPLTYQWYYDNNLISGATGASYTIASAAPANFGFYDVLVTNAGGSVSSAYAILGVRATGAPAVTGQPQSQTMAAGSTVVLTVTSSGTVTAGSVSEGPRSSPDASSPTTYQWYLNGVPIAGATSQNLVLSNASAATAGTYKCLVSNASGSNLSSAAIVNVTSTSDPGRLVNLSVNTFDGAGSQALTVGFVTGGAGTAGSQTLLIRASGPALTAFGVAGVLPDPAMTVFNTSGGVVTTNAGWASTLGNQAAVTAADLATFAFPLTNPASLDSAVVSTLAESAGYSVLIAGKSGDTGNTLGEVYDNTAAGTYALTTPRLVNLSCKSQVGAGKTLTVGFVLGGTTSKTVLIRASGPALTAFGTSGVMPDPQLTLFSGSTALASNTGWGGDPQLTAAMAEVYAFLYTNPSSADSALLVTLPPGAYTAQVSSVSGTAGITLVEIYDVP